MKKEIRFRATAKKAAELGYPTKFELALVPAEIDTATLSPAAAWIADHITATYICDEYRDRCRITAVDGLTKAERDRKSGKSEEDIAWFTRAYGDYYAKEPWTIRVTFPIYGARHRCPADVIEEAVKQLIDAGSAELIADNGDRYTLNGPTRKED